MNHKNKYETITSLKRTPGGAYVLRYRTNPLMPQAYTTHAGIRAVKVFNNNTIKVYFTDGSSTAATKGRFAEQSYEDWYESGVMTCLAKRWIGFNKTYNQSAFMKLVDAVLKDDARIQKNEAELKIAEEQSKIKYAKYVAKKRLARRESMENPNKFLGKLVKVKHLNQVGTIINYSEAHDSFIVNLGMGINNMYSLNQLIFIDNSLNNDLKGFQALSKEELSELLIEQNEQK